MNQSKLLNLWFTKANEIKKQLRAIELKGQLANGQTKDELIATLKNLEVRTQPAYNVKLTSI